VSSGTKRLLLLAGVGLLILTIGGCLVGAVIKGTDEAFLPKPHIALPAEELATIGPLVITNTILSSWIATAVLILLFVLATRRMSPVPRGLQNAVEFVVEGLSNFVNGVVGERYGRSFFPLFATIFLFVVVNAWLGLIPIYQSLAIFENGHVKAHVLRPAGTDINMTFALALISVVFIEAWGFRAHGFAFLGEFIRVKVLFRDFPRNLFMGLIDVFVGILELLSHFIRIVSFGFRLFGNMTAGEILLLVTAFLGAFALTLFPFYGLELLVGFIQALVFAGLTLVFASVAVAVAEGEEHH